MAIDESSFQAIADETLRRYQQAIEAAMPDDVDAEFSGGMLILECDTGIEYVLSKHAVTKELWLSSPASGGHHFEYDDARATWVSTRSGVLLSDLLARELTAETGVEVKLA